MASAVAPRNGRAFVHTMFGADCLVGSPNKCGPADCAGGRQSIPGTTGAEAAADLEVSQAFWAVAAIA